MYVENHDIFLGIQTSQFHMSVS